ncbi:MAG TPA: YecA family protein, partial [Albitalea sp.]|nr:YecA family protein [Albitalea sp.]
MPAPTAHDLTDAEFAELDDLLAATPEPLEPCDVVMLDGYLCCVLVQPVLLEPAAWLPHVFDFEGQPLPDDVDPAWLARTQQLILRRHAALNRAIVEDGWFNPLILEPDDDEQAPPPVAGVSPLSQPLMPWVAGFQHAALCFPDLAELSDDDVSLALARLYRHLPAETDEEREVVATIEREFPLATLDDAIEDLVVAVADLSDLT